MLSQEFLHQLNAYFYILNYQKLSFWKFCLDWLRPRMLDRPAGAAYAPAAVRWPDGCCPNPCGAGRGKSGLHRIRMPGNARRGRPQGKCHRKQTAGPGNGPPARVKRCGKSAPPDRQRDGHGKPHPEQDHVGTRVASRDRCDPAPMSG